MTIRNLFTLPAIAVALATGSAGAFAQTATPAPATDASPAPDMGTPHHHKNRMMAALRELGLSDDQKSKLKTILTSYRDARTSATPETHEQLRSQI